MFYCVWTRTRYTPPPSASEFFFGIKRVYSSLGLCEFAMKYDGADTWPSAGMSVLVMVLVLKDSLRTTVISSHLFLACSAFFFGSVMKTLLACFPTYLSLLSLTTKPCRLPDRVDYRTEDSVCAVWSTGVHGRNAISRRWYACVVYAVISCCCSVVYKGGRILSNHVYCSTTVD